MQKPSCRRSATPWQRLLQPDEPAAARRHRRRARCSAGGPPPGPLAHRGLAREARRTCPTACAKLLWVGAPLGADAADPGRGRRPAARDRDCRRDIVDVAVQLIGLLLLIRVVVYVLRVSLGARARIKGWGTPITLRGLGLPVAAPARLGRRRSSRVLDGIGINAGKTRISVWSVMKLLVTVSLFVLARACGSRAGSSGACSSSTASRRTCASASPSSCRRSWSACRCWSGLNAAGLDLTTLNVLTGAIGIGLGFGLQSIAANFVSGFVLLMDRSIKPGDVISFTGTTGTTTEGFGWVEELRGRYVVVRDRDGVETLVPNQHLITNPVINWSYTDPRVRLKLPVRVSYKDDPELAMRLLLQATEGHPRIIREPAPVARLMGVRRPRHRARAALLDSGPAGRRQQRALRRESRASGGCSRTTASRSRSRSARSASRWRTRRAGAPAPATRRLRPCRSRSPNSLSIPDELLEFRAVRASGPGRPERQQGLERDRTALRLSAAWDALWPTARARLQRLAGRRMTDAGHDRDRRAAPALAGAEPRRRARAAA